MPQYIDQLRQTLKSTLKSFLHLVQLYLSQSEAKTLSVGDNAVTPTWKGKERTQVQTVKMTYIIISSYLIIELYIYMYIVAKVNVSQLIIPKKPSCCGLSALKKLR